MSLVVSRVYDRKLHRPTTDVDGGPSVGGTSSTSIGGRSSKKSWSYRHRVSESTCIAMSAKGERFKTEIFMTSVNKLWCYLSYLLVVMSMGGNASNYLVCYVKRENGYLYGEGVIERESEDEIVPPTTESDRMCTCCWESVALGGSGRGCGAIEVNGEYQ